MVNTHLSSNIGDDLLVAAFLYFVYLLLTDVESNGGEDERLAVLSKSCVDISFVPISGLTMRMLISVSFAVSDGMETSLIMSEFNSSSPTVVLLRLA